MQVVHVICTYPEEFEADLLEFFGVDLRDVWRRKITFRRLGVLLKSILSKKGRSTLASAISERAEWGAEAYLLARVSDALELTNYLILSAFSSEKIDPPKPIPRPGDEEEEPQEKKFSTPEEIAGFFARFSNR